MSSYAAIKARLVAGCAARHRRRRRRPLPPDRRRAGIGRPHVVRISQTDGLDAASASTAGCCTGAWRAGPEASFDLSAIGSLRGRHNAPERRRGRRRLHARSACRTRRSSPGSTSFPGLAHRMEQVGRAGRVLFVNDSKATNAEAAAPALAAFPRIHWIAGGLPKEGGIASLAPFFPRIAKAYLIGEAAPAFAATLGKRIPYEISGTLESRSSARRPMRRRTRRRRARGRRRSCSCRRPVPASTSSAISRYVATPSATRYASCRAWR